jgi:hypothetical protein
MNMEDIHYNKYIKYKTKYLELKELNGGGFFYTSCKIAPRQSNNHSHSSTDNIITENNGINKITFKSQEEAQTRNSIQEEHIDNIYNPLIKILNNLKNIHKFKNFQDIFDKLTESKINYTSYNNTISTIKYQNEINTQLNTIRNNIKVIEGTINKNIDNIKKYNFSINLNNNINTEIKNITTLDHIFKDKKKDEGICSLQYIITCYFDKIIDGLECLISVQHFNK